MLRSTYGNQIHLRLSISEELDGSLTNWARESSCDRAEILRKALTLYAVAAEAEQGGYQMAIVSESDEVLRRIDGVK